MFSAHSRAGKSPLFSKRRPSLQPTTLRSWTLWEGGSYGSLARRFLLRRERYHHELMDAEERCELVERIIRLRCELGF
jgi:hypothetical protein